MTETLPILCVLCGLAAIVAGVAMWSVPAAFIVGGVLLALIGLAADVSKERTNG